jgi:two-component system LytT family response regulator
MRALIIEDSREDALNLRELLASMPAVEFVAQAHSLDEARSALEEAQPDIVFLDIELGHESGLDLLPQLPRGTRVIFTTIHTGFGPEAFEANAADYMVKPVSEARLLRAMAKAGAASCASAASVPVYRGGSERLQVALETVAAVLADRDYSLVHCGSRVLPDHRSLREWAQLLAGHSFFQLDRSTLLRRDLVHSWTPYGRGFKIKFRNSPLELELGRAAACRFVEMMAVSSKNRPSSGLPLV